MTNIAILVGNSEYLNENPLPCCEADVLAMRELIEATGRFDHIELVLNAEAALLKDRIRTTVDAYKQVAELLFYFTGHGHQNETDFFYCATNFDSKRPNETGLSNADLHPLLKVVDAELVVKVIDACSSGTQLIKSTDGSFLPIQKGNFKNFLQIASCLDSQDSPAGHPLSPFTENFRLAALRKTEGPVLYTDIVDTLRDEYLANTIQTPHFVSQGTQRAQFVDNAKRLDPLREKLAAATAENETAIVSVPALVDNPPNTLAILQAAEKRFASKQTANAFMANLFDKLAQKASEQGAMGDLFTTEVVEHSDYQEPTTRAFIIRVLSNERRPDNFVTAAIAKEHRRRDPFNLAGFASGLLADPDDMVSHYDLKLNCELDKAQLKITLTPKFVTLKRFVLVVSCAPSLEVCYVLEMLTQHLLRDWGVFDPEGREIIRRWYKMDWTDPCDFIVGKILDKLKEAVQEDVDSAAKALAKS